MLTETLQSTMTKNKDRKTPEELGFRMPAEWERHEATWLGWPHELTDWPGKFAPIPWAFAEMVRLLSQVERVFLLVQDGAAEKRCARNFEKGGSKSGGGGVFSRADGSRMDAGFRADLREECSGRSGVQQFCF